MSKEALKLALEAMEDHGHAWARHEVQYSNAMIALREALAEQPAQQTPVAWMYDQAKYRENDLRGRQWAFNCFSQNKPWVDDMVRNLTPLYTSPPAQRKPLTDEEIKQFASKHLDVGDGAYATHFVTGDVAFARAIEAAHGIKENT
jgi:hypothetical protein